ncbi:MAG: acyl carrier protein [Clostridiales bacterium]|nr:MAG: acyl carrier protein [Clostridiales bacterium]
MELKKIQDIISKYLGIDADSITEESSFKDMEVDSLDMAEITIEIEDTFDIVIEETEEIQTVGDIIKLIQEK